MIDIDFRDITPLSYKKLKNDMKANKGVKGEEVANIVFSDWQLGHKTETFNHRVARERVRNICESAVDIIQTHRKRYDIRKLNIYLLGDFIQNEPPFYVDLESLEAIILEQMFQMAIPTLEEAITYLSMAFDQVNIICVRGNHGRVGGKMNSQATNYDTIIYNILRERFKEWEHVKWEIAKEWFIVHKEYKYGYLAIHGDNIRAGSYGIPQYGIQQKIMRWADSIRQKWDILLLGHFHCFGWNEINTKQFIVNGTLVTDDEYVRRNTGWMGSNAQVLFGCHKNHPISWVYKLEG